MITVQGRKLIIPKEERNIGTIADNHTTTRIFKLNRFSDGVDISTLSFKLDIEYTADDGSKIKNIAELNKRVSDHNIYLEWVISKADLPGVGVIYIQIRACDLGFLRFNTASASMFVDGIIGEYDSYKGDLSELRFLEAKIGNLYDRFIQTARDVPIALQAFSGNDKAAVSEMITLDKELSRIELVANTDFRYPLTFWYTFYNLGYKNGVETGYAEDTTTFYEIGHFDSCAKGTVISADIKVKKYTKDEIESNEMLAEKGGIKIYVSPGYVSNGIGVDVGGVITGGIASTDFTATMYDLSTLGVPINDLLKSFSSSYSSERIEEIVAEIYEKIQTESESLQAQINSANDDIGNLSTSVLNIQSEIDQNVDDIAELSGSVEELKGDLADITESYYITEDLEDRENGSAVNYLGVKLTGLGTFAMITTQCTEGDVFFYSGELLGSAGIARSAFFNGDTFVNYDVKSTSSAVIYNNEKIVIPSGVNKVVFSAYTSSTTFKVVALKMKKSVKNESEFVGNNGFNGHSEMPKFNTDYAQIICYGQSLSNGSDSLYVPDSVANGVYMLGSIDTPSATLNPISASQQHPIISATNSLSTLVRNYYKKNIEFICGSYGVGGQSIAQLMSTSRQAEIKSEEGYSYDIDTNGRYQVFLNSLTYGKQIADSKNKTISCPVIVFLQGERDYYSDESLGGQSGSTVHAYACDGDKDKYKLYMKRLKEDMQNAIMSTYGQTEKPLFFIYEVSGGFVKNERMTINTAQIEFAEENDDVILLPAPYFTPNYNSSHLSTNGYRWYGEYIAKAIFDKLFRGEEHNVLKPIGYYVEGKNIHIKVDDVVGGLSLDDYTVERANDYGFNIILNETTFVSKCTPHVCGDEIIVEAPIDISGANYTSIEIVYAGIRSNGTGNVRDNAKYYAMYKYWDDTNDRGSSNSLTISHRPTDKNGSSMIGKKYPMNKWLIPFCFKAR